MFLNYIYYCSYGFNYRIYILLLIKFWLYFNNNYFVSNNYYCFNNLFCKILIYFSNNFQALENARRVFDKMPRRDVSWTTLIFDKMPNWVLLTGFLRFLS